MFGGVAEPAFDDDEQLVRGNIFEFSRFEKSKLHTLCLCSSNLPSLSIARCGISAAEIQLGELSLNVSSVSCFHICDVLVPRRS